MAALVDARVPGAHRGRALLCARAGGVSARRPAKSWTNCDAVRIAFVDLGKAYKRYAASAGRGLPSGCCLGAARHEAELGAARRQLRRRAGRGRRHHRRERRRQEHAAEAHHRHHAAHRRARSHARAASPRCSSSAWASIPTSPAGRTSSWPASCWASRLDEIAHADAARSRHSPRSANISTSRCASTRAACRCGSPSRRDRDAPRHPDRRRGAVGRRRVLPAQVLRRASAASRSRARRCCSCRTTGAVKTLCDRALLLDRGLLAKDGAPDEVLDYYNAAIARREADYEIRAVESARPGRPRTRSGDRKATIERSISVDASGPSVRALQSGASATHPRAFVVTANDRVVDGRVPDPRPRGQRCFGTNTHHLEAAVRRSCPAGATLRIRHRRGRARPGPLQHAVALHESDSHLVRNHDWWDQALVFQVLRAGRAVSDRHRQPADPSAAASWEMGGRIMATVNGFLRWLKSLRTLNRQRTRSSARAF